jgi:hypothetical protein
VMTTSGFLCVPMLTGEKMLLFFLCGRSMMGKREGRGVAK